MLHRISDLRLGLAVLVVTATAGVAIAQTGVGPRDPNMPDPKNVPAEKVAPQEPGATGSMSGAGTLSEKLGKSEGVITPGPTGDANQVIAPAPNPGTTPVIRPPGTLSSDPIQPK